MPAQLGLRLKVLRAVIETIREMAKDDACEGMDLGQLLAELVTRLKNKMGAGEIDWDAILEIIMELVPLIIALIQMFFAV